MLGWSALKESFCGDACNDMCCVIEEFFAKLQSGAVLEAVTFAAQQSWDSADSFWASAYPRLNDCEPRLVKTICIYYFSLGMGGAERVVAKTAALLDDLGYRVIVLTDENSGDDYFHVPPSVKRLRAPGQTYGFDSMGNRLKRLESIIHNEDVDAFFSFQYQGNTLPWDMLLCRCLNIPFLLMQQSSLVSFFNEGNTYNIRLSRCYRYADSIVVLNKADLVFWSLFNSNVHLIPNMLTFPLPDKQDVASLDGNTVVWIGRLSEKDKRPSEALRVMANVLQRCPDATLLMVGPAESDAGLASLNELASSLGIADSVEFYGPADDVRELLQCASVCLLTSRYEGYCLSLGESKEMGVPCVAYSLPYLLLFENQRGMRVVPQGDQRAAANEICGLLNCKEERKKLGADAYLHMSELSTFGWKEAWRDVVAGLERGGCNCESDNHLADAFDLIVEGQLATCASSEASFGRLSYERDEAVAALNEVTASTTWRVGKFVTKSLRFVKDKLSRR